MALINKKKLSNLVDKTKEATEKIKDNAVAFIDQNNDGELNAEDFARVKDKAKIIAADGKDKARELVIDSKEKLDKALIEKEINKYNPINKDEFFSDEFKLPRIIRLLENNPYTNKETCKNAIAFNTNIAKSHVLELVKGENFEDKMSFYPNMSGSLYLQNPYKENMYIELNEYFEYFQKARVAELIKIANSLGAKYVKITYMEKERSFVSKSVNKNTNGPALNGLNLKEKISINASSKESKELMVSNQETFVGHNNPTRPELFYFKDDEIVENYIDSCLGNNPSLHKEFTIKYNASKECDMQLASDIDAVLGKLKCSGSTSMKSAVSDDKSISMTFEIKF